MNIWKSAAGSAPEQTATGSAPRMPLGSRRPTRRPMALGVAVLGTVLAVEFADELADGAKTAALPLIRHSLSLSYGQIGLLASIPLIVGGLIELPMGIAAGHGRRRQRFVRAGGVVFAAALCLAAMAGSFPVLLTAFVVFFPASGAFVTLTESSLMDADPARSDQNMARWTVAGSLGSVAGPLVLAAVLTAGQSWRFAYLLLAAAGAAALLGVTGAGPALRSAGRAAGGSADGEPGAADGEPGAGDGFASRVREALGALRRPDVVRWLILVQVSDLLLDVLTGFAAVYLVDVAHATPAQAALGVGARLVAALAGELALVPVLERARGLAVLRASAVAAAFSYPAFLLVPGLWPKVAILAVVSAVTAPWYPVTQAQLYRSLPGRSPVAVSLGSAAALAGGAGPLAVGFLAQRFGLGWALAVLAAAPVCLLAATHRLRGAGQR